MLSVMITSKLKMSCFYRFLNLPLLIPFSAPLLLVGTVRMDTITVKIYLYLLDTGSPTGLYPVLDRSSTVRSSAAAA